MKKVKAMFAGLAILAVVGGAFAFKAKHNYSASIFYTTYTTSYVGQVGNIPATFGEAAPTFGLFYYTVTSVSGQPVLSKKVAVQTPE